MSAQPVVTEEPVDEGSSAKAPGAFRTISEVAEELNVPQHVLRFWETRFFQVRPLKRSGGRRYYRPEDVALLKKIHHLLYSEGYTIRGVQKLLKGVSKAQLLKEQGAVKPGPLVDASDVVSPPANQSGVVDVVTPVVTATQVETATQSVTETVVLEAGTLSGKQRAALQSALANLKTLQALLKSA
jgi:DNA-binding transcriptional MerR regulator